MQEYLFCRKKVFVIAIFKYKRVYMTKHYSFAKIYAGLFVSKYDVVIIKFQISYGYQIKRLSNSN